MQLYYIRDGMHDHSWHGYQLMVRLQLRMDEWRRMTYATGNKIDLHYGSIGQDDDHFDQMMMSVDYRGANQFRIVIVLLYDISTCRIYLSLALPTASENPSWDRKNLLLPSPLARIAV